MVPTKDQIEAYLYELDEWAWRSLQAAAADIPNLNDIANRIWADLGRYGPPQLPGLGVFDIPPHPPPQPPPSGLLERTGGWIVSHKLKAATLGVCFVLGSGLFAGYVHARMRHARHKVKSKHANKTRERKEVAVVLGADSALGYQLVLELESRGFIVIATVSKAELAEEFESVGNGYVRALVLDPAEPSSVSSFIRSLQSSLSLRFPTTGAGDPYYSSPSLHPHITSVISLLTLDDPPPPTPFESLSLKTSYLPYIHRSHITPLQTIQNLLPMMRVPANSNEAPSRYKRKKKIVVCVPVIASRVGVSWNSAQSMSAGATAKAMDVLRRELRDSGQASKIGVTVADVGFVGSPLSSYNSGTAAYTTDWSQNIRSTYGPAFLGAMEHSRVNPRQSYNIHDVVGKLVTMVDEPRSSYLSQIPMSCFSRDTILVGAGAYTYGIASTFPNWVLDGILSIPSRLSELRNSLIMHVSHPPNSSSSFLGPPRETKDGPENLKVRTEVVEEEKHSTESSPASSKERLVTSGYSSDAEALGLTSNDQSTTGSWVNLEENKE